MIIDHFVQLEKSQQTYRNYHNKLDLLDSG